MLPIRHKFNAKPTVIDNVRFASKKEGAYYQKLKARKESGEVLFFLMQAPLHSKSGIRYLVDFVEFHADGTVHFIDVKGCITQVYALKKKLIENEFPIKIEEV
jgi:hypothetical protein